MNISVYVDESGTHSKSGELPGSEMAVVAGYGASTDEWNDFRAKWQCVLKKYNVYCFHYYELEDRKKWLNPNSAYFQWNETRRDEFLIELAKVVFYSKAKLFGGIYRTKDAHKYFIQNPTASKDDPYKGCIDWFYGAFRLDMNLFWSAKDDTFTFFFDQTGNTEWRKSVNEIHFLHQKAEPRINTLVNFCDKKDAKHIPLQAADLVVYRFRRKMAKCFEQPTVAPDDLDYLLFSESFFRTLSLGDQ